MHLVEIKQDLCAIRLDKLLCKKFSVSYSLAQKIIRAGKIKVNGKKINSSYKTQIADQIEVFFDLEQRCQTLKKKPKISAAKMQQFFSRIIFEDDNLIAIDKPSGLATQGGSKIEIAVDDFLFGQKLQLVHRLDKDTSGILLIAKNSVSAQFLTDAFRNKIIKKTYLALVLGVLKKPAGVINIPLRKKLQAKNEKVRPDFSAGKAAITEFKLLKAFSDYSLVELHPLTGRTHQLRVHCKEIGHPILNDVKYGGKKVLRRDICQRLCLHAYKIELANYFGKKLKIETSLPEYVI